MPRKNLRIPLPTNPTGSISLLSKIKAKHLELGDDSPLKGLKWSKITPDLDASKSHDDEAVRLSKLAEKEYGERNKTLPTVTETLKAARDILFGLNRENPKALGDFGFTVDDTPKAKKIVAPKVP